MERKRRSQVVAECGFLDLRWGKSTNATPVGSDRWRTTSGSDTYIVLNFTGPAQLFNVLIYATDPNNTGALLKNLQFYRLEDEADLQAGKVFRTPYKKSLVDLCPSAIQIHGLGRRKQLQAHAF